jgi:hypothetical protein
MNKTALLTIVIALLVLSGVAAAVLLFIHLPLASAMAGTTAVFGFLGGVLGTLLAVLQNSQRLDELEKK